MDTFDIITEILRELLDIDDVEIKQETYLVRDLGAESIDFLELAVAINSHCGIKVNDDDIFLRPLRFYLNQTKESGADPASYIGEKFPFLAPERVREILEDLKQGPVLKVQDLVRYVDWRKGL